MAAGTPGHYEKINNWIIFKSTLLCLLHELSINHRRAVYSPLKMFLCLLSLLRSASCPWMYSAA